MRGGTVKRDGGVCGASRMLKRQGSDKSANPINKPFISGKNVTIANPPEMDANQGPPLARSFIYREKIRDSAGERIRRRPNTIHYGRERMERKGVAEAPNNPVDADVATPRLWQFLGQFLIIPVITDCGNLEDETKRWRMDFDFGV